MNNRSIVSTGILGPVQIEYYFDAMTNAPSFHSGLSIKPLLTLIAEYCVCYGFTCVLEQSRGLRYAYGVACVSARFLWGTDPNDPNADGGEGNGVLIADMGNRLIRAYHPLSDSLWTVAGTTAVPGQAGTEPVIPPRQPISESYFGGLIGLCVDPETNRVFVSDNHYVRVLDETGHVQTLYDPHRWAQRFGRGNTLCAAGMTFFRSSDDGLQNLIVCSRGKQTPAPPAPPPPPPPAVRLPPSSDRVLYRY